MLEKPVQEKLLSIAKELNEISKIHQISIGLDSTPYEWDNPKISIRKYMHSDYDQDKPTSTKWTEDCNDIIDGIAVEAKSFIFINDESEVDVA